MGILIREDIVEKVDTAIEKLKDGEIIILTDNVDRENEGDLVCLAGKTSWEMIDFMTRHGRGLICAPLGPELVVQLGLNPAVPGNDSPFYTPFTESLDIKAGGTTGISADERARTLRQLANPEAKGSDFTYPGHIFPLRANPDGIFGRAGHTEGAVDLARLCGAAPAAVICEILGEGGGMSRGEALDTFALRENLFCISMEELTTYLYRPIETVNMPLKLGAFTMSVYPKLPGETEPPVVLRSRAACKEGLPVPVRIHSQCMTGDLFGSQRCDCGEQLDQALEILAEEGGLLIYLPQEGRGIGLTEKIKAYKLQEMGMDTIEANLALGHQVDSREYSSAIRILKAEGIRAISLFTNNPAKYAALKEAGFEVERRALEIPPGEHNFSYLITKQNNMGHLLSLKERA
ncbi:MAG: 3,4-dihydroxy-2-butanone-4-phosphate synthase [Spirochaetales bacterium]|nr:3,4-dihydroxy-2-butanone-4-phosphate synthase [Spirochaetales bacterium]